MTERMVNLERRVRRLEQRMEAVVGPREPTLLEVRRAVLDYLQDHDSIEAYEFAFRRNLPYDLVEQVMAELRERGTLERADE